MIGYTTLGTNDLPKAIKFYDALLADLNAKQIINDGRIVVWAGEGSGFVAVCKPYDEKPATVGNGTMVALNVGNKEKINAMHKKALSLGGTNEGDPGPRGGGDSFYGGYFRDLDGNKFVLFMIGE